MKTVIVSTDASVCPTTGSAGWGAVIKEQAAERTYQGVIRGCKDNCLAEVLALTTGIRMAVDHCGLAPGDVIQAVSDSEYALDVVGDRRQIPLSPGRHTDAVVAADLRRFLNDRGIVLELQHVPAHSGHRTMAHAMNAVADAMARASLAVGRMRAAKLA